MDALLPSIPAIEELKKHRQWVAWKYEFRNGPDSKPTKPPISPRTGFGASHSKPETWGTYQEAFERARKSNLPGVGFVLTDDDEICGIDLDACRDAETGELSPWAAEIVALAETYAEVSPSGEGIRLFARGKPEKTIKADKANVEIYGKLRYLTVTGQHVDGTPDEIRPAPQSMGALVARVEAARQEQKPAQETRQFFVIEDGSDFFERVNAAALANLSSWVPSIFPSARFQQSTGAYRVPSRDLGRDLEEDLSIAPNGIVDFGVHDMGDARDGKRSAIDLAMEYGLGQDAKSAAFWLCDQLGKTPDAFGWEELPPILPNIEEIIQAVYESHERKRGAKTASGVEPFDVTWFCDIELDIVKNELIEDWAGVGELIIPYGAPKSGKSVIIGDACCHIGAGWRWFGKRVVQSAVLYVAAERSRLVKRRFAAFRKHHEIDDLPVAVISGYFDMAKARKDTDRIIATLEKMKADSGLPVVLVIDTKRQVIADENSADVPALVGNIARIQTETDATVFVIDHTPFHSPKKPAGNGALLAAADVAAIVEKIGDVRTMTIVHANDAEEDLSIAFALQSVDLGTNRNTGKTTKAPVVVPADEPEPGKKATGYLTASEKIALQALEEAVTEAGERVGSSYVPDDALTVSIDLWREYAYARGISDSDKPDARKKAFQRARKELLVKDRVATWNDHVWLVRPSGKTVADLILSRSGHGT